MMKDVLDRLESDFEAVERQLSDPALLADMDRYREATQRHAELREKVEAHRAHQELLAEQRDLEELAQDDQAEGELRELAETELAEVRERAARAEEELMLKLLPKDPDADRNAIVEIRSGTGGDEAALFADDLFRMYTRLAERKGWKWELLDAHETGIGGYNKIVFGLSGQGAYGTLRQERGVHRVQRVPKTESSGRIHTSAATVAVLPEAEEVDVHIDPGDLDMRSTRASGPGGQHMQKNETAVRVLHKPTGIVVTCQDQRSQHQNKEQALRILRSRLLDLERAKQQEEISAARREQVKSGDRSDKIRTYNFPQDRVTDHRINLTLHNLSGVLDGELDELFEGLEREDQQRRMQEASGE
jgi:peptide chain release factor 1